MRIVQHPCQRENPDSYTIYSRLLHTKNFKQEIKNICFTLKMHYFKPEAYLVNLLKQHEQELIELLSEFKNALQIQLYNFVYDVVPVEELNNTLIDYCTYRTNINDFRIFKHYRNEEFYEKLQFVNKITKEE